MFENDFDSFRVFLEAFVPVAFAHVFSENVADRLEFSVSIPQSTERAFQAVADEQSLRERTVAIAAPPPGSAHVGPPIQTQARERAEWLWRLANGSLLIPVLLTLAVAYFGLSLLMEIRASQNDLLKPMLDHNLKLLEEDRRRLQQGTANVAQPASPKP